MQKIQSARDGHAPALELRPISPWRSVLLGTQVRQLPMPWPRMRRMLLTSTLQ